MIIFFVVVIAIGFVFSQIMEDSNILYFAVIFSLLMNFFSYWFSDKVVLKMSGAKLADKNENFELYGIVQNLSMKARLPMPKLYIISDSSPNAFATGRNAKNSAVAVTTGLLNILEKNELEGVIAHELSHIGNRDILLSTIVVVLVGFVALLADWFRWSLIFGGSRDSDSGGSNIMAVIGVVLAILAPIAVTLIQLAISRKREFLADSSGALLTSNPRGLADALKKISGSGIQLKKANRATAHMYISNPFKGKSMVKMFMTHPPVEERVEALIGGK
ncbi:zinc metalloprotease HtpX [Patescibacteria group bacterium]|nr:zinc metalloprotease HtpX [Patescibacteria group bacterium]